MGIISTSLMLYNANTYSNYSKGFNWVIFYKYCSIKIIWKVMSDHHFQALVDIWMTSVVYFTLLNDLLFLYFYSRQILLLLALLTGRKTIFSFPKFSEKTVFPKQLHWNMNFLVLSGKMVFLPENIWSYSLDGKWKMIFLKIYMEIWYFLYIR